MRKREKEKDSLVFIHGAHILGNNPETDRQKSAMEFDRPQ